MSIKNGPASLRLIISLLLGTVFALFAAALLTIFFSTMPKMLLESENKYVTQQLAVVNGLLASSQRDTALLTRDTAIWDESYQFVTGQNPNYISDNWTDFSILESFRQNFVIYKNLSGEDVYIDFYDHINNRELPVPPGFSDHLSELVSSMLNHDSDLVIEDDGMGGVDLSGEKAYTMFSGMIFFEGTCYSLSASPIMLSQEGSRSGGVLIMGNILNNDYFRELTHFDSQFEFIGGESGQTLDSNLNFHFIDDSTVYGDLPLFDLYGMPMTLRMIDSRPIYHEGQQTIQIAFFLLLAAMGVFGFTLYQLTSRNVVRPIEELSRQIAATGPQVAMQSAANAQNAAEQSAAGAARLDVEKFSTNSEFALLSTSINDMLDRLAQSNISLDVFRNILNGLDAQIYVTDPFTDDILFVNSHLKADFKFEGDVTGRKCWEVLNDLDSRCHYCPKAHLLENPDSVMVWNHYNDKVKHWFRNCDVLIDWPGRGKVHMQSASDITQVRLAEQLLQERLERQKILALISQSFISTQATGELISEALHISGEYLHCDRVGVFVLNEKERTLDPAFQWLRPGQAKTPPMTRVPFAEGDLEYQAFIVQKAPYLTCGQDKNIEDYPSAHENGVQSFISAPIYAEGKFWGMLCFCHTEQAKIWTSDDRQLALLISGVISVAVSRGIMEDSLQRMSAIVDSSPQFIAYVNENGKFEYFNQGALDQLGYTAAELEAGGLTTIFDGKTYSLVRGELIPRIMHTGESEYELPMLRRNGEERIMAVSAFKTDTKNKSSGIGIIATDITEQRKLERELINAKEHAEQSSQAKGDFLSRMSHEMRTPMNAIIGMTSIAKSSREMEKKEYCLDKIDDASKHLLGVINDILDMSKIEANKFELSYTEFCFEKMLMRVVNVINFRVDEKKLTLIVNVDKAMPHYIVSDEQRLAQVITNLIGNAVKFTPEHGVITLNAKVSGQKRGLYSLQISVTDTGIGISSEQQRRLFRSFEQADGGISRKFGGTGLGLAISRSIVELMGGKIWVESRLGQGATFSFSFTAQKGQTLRPSKLNPDVDWKALRVLVVDDAPEVLEYFANFAKTIGLACTVVDNAAEAEKLLSYRGPDAFNMVFVDWQMPDMNGIELTRRIRNTVGSSMVVIMISATQWNEIESEATEAGVDKFIPKPLFPSLIVDCINECMNVNQYESKGALPRTITGKPLAGTAGQSETAQGGSGSVQLFASGQAQNAALDDASAAAQSRAAADSEVFEPGCFKGYKILLAEDIPINSEIAITLLEDTGIVIDCALNGQEVFDMFCANPDGYDLILMDIHMPEVDGYEATKLIRSLHSTKAASIPIVAMTANVFREDIEHCLSAGMDDHIGKPIDMEEILRKLRKHLPRR